MRRLSFFALGATALCAVAFSPGLEFGALLTIVALTTALCVLAVPWLKSTFISLIAADDPLTGHGHVHSRAGGLGAGGRHGPPRSILFLLIVWALVVAILTGLWHAILQLLTSAGYRLANTTASAQPLPS